MSDQLKPLTREELEKRAVDDCNKENVVCKTKEYCSRAGNYTPCYFHLYMTCPFFKTYYQQFKEDVDPKMKEKDKIMLEWWKSFY